MRVLLLHNRYRAAGGEERAVAETAGLLARSGHEVQLLERNSAGVSRRRAAASLLGGGWRPDELAEAVRRTGAEIVHAHNLHPLYGWRALAAARSAGARTVLQLHNFRLFCAIGVAYRDGAPCHRCRGRNTLPGLALRCRGPLFESAVYAGGLARQQPQLLAQADRFVVLSQAHGERLHELGLPRGRTDVLANFLPDSSLAPASLAAVGRYALVAGRLVAEKGFDTAIRACAAAGVPLVVAGEGPDEGRLRALAADEGRLRAPAAGERLRAPAAGQTRFTGWLEPAALAGLRRGAGLMLVPSRCEEACPYAALEALAAGVPVLVSDRGGLPELVAPGAALAADAVDAWTAALRELWPDAVRRDELGALALRAARERFSEAAYLERLLEVYDRARSGAGRRGAAA